MIALYIIENILFPPAITLLLVVVGWLLFRSGRRRMGKFLAVSGLVILYVASLPVTARVLSYYLENHAPLDAGDCSLQTDADAIVVLAYTRDEEGREFGRPMSSGEEMERLRYAAYLYQCTQLPVVVVGGDALETGIREADLMRHTLEKYFHVPVLGADGRSRHTWDNATYAKEILWPRGIHRILLVTHAWHMQRAMHLFQDKGFIVQPASTAFTRFNRLSKGLNAWIPSAGFLAHNKRLAHEYVGILLNALRG